MSVVASSDVVSALIGAGAAIAGVALTALAAVGLETRRHRAELVSAAITDVFAAMGESAVGRDEPAKAKYAEAKARLLAYGPADVIQALLAFERGAAQGTNPAAQDAIIKLAFAARSAMRSTGQVTGEDAKELLFGYPGVKRAS